MAAAFAAVYAGKMWRNGRPARGSAPASESELPELDASPSCRRVDLVLVEEGTRWLAAPGAAVALVQGAAERPTAFALRAVRRILAIEQSGRSIGCALLVLAPRFDPEVTAARLLIARGLITHSASVGLGSSELLLRAGRPPARELQHSLPSLMDALLGESGSWALPIRVSFDAGQAPS